MDKRLFFVASVAILAITACGSTKENDDSQSAEQQRFIVVQNGSGGAKTQFVLCEQGTECQQRSTKFLTAKKQISQKIEPQIEERKFSVHFPFGKHIPSKDGLLEIEKAIETIAKAGVKKVIVSGRTDPIGSLTYNEKLAQNRADFTRQKLLDAGIQKEKVEAIVSSPCCDGDSSKSKDDLASLRRADITIEIIK